MIVAICLESYVFWVQYEKGDSCGGWRAGVFSLWNNLFKLLVYCFGLGSIFRAENNSPDDTEPCQTILLKQTKAV